MASPPPYYPDNNAPAPAGAAPPQYENVASSSSQPLAAQTDTPTFLIDDCVVLEQSRNRVHYELGNPLGNPTTEPCSITKHCYPSNSEPCEKPPRVHLYDFQDTWSQMGGVHLAINGRAGEDLAYPGLFLVQGVGSAAYQVAGHFKASQGVLDRIKNKNQITWVDTKDRVVGVEFKQSLNKDSGQTSPPRIEVKVPLDEKELDLLVTCWCAKVWHETGKPPKEPMSWQKC
ncbi:hypothetical protein FSOLCH5_013253 [Fusarium solani]